MEILPFVQVSSLTKVRRLRVLALEVLKYYSIKVKTIEFIRHSANTIFKITDKNKRRYALRIHPCDRHSKKALLEEIKWLNFISKTSDISVPTPVCTINGKYIVEVNHPAMDAARYCDLFEWVEGRFQWKSINTHYAYCLGSTIGKLQKTGKKIQIKHRIYWDTEGIVGTDKARFTNIEKLTGVSDADQNMITAARRCVYRKLKAFEKAFPERLGLIHADMTPNNFMLTKNHCSVIDFDDCGVGFYGYDLVTPLFSFEYITQTDKKKYVALKDALFEGYCEHMPLTQTDINLVPYFLLAMKLFQVGYFEMHKDHPRFKPYFLKGVKRAIKSFKEIKRLKL